MKIYCFLFVLCFAPGLPLVSQSLRSVPYYSPGAEVARQKLAEEVATSVRQKFSAPQKFNKEAQKSYAVRKEEMALDVSEEIKAYAVTDDVLWPYLQKTLAKITDANPKASNARAILVANPTANAYSIGEGTIVVYTGLLAGLENEDQLAFVLCHEIAHYLLEHATNRLNLEIETLHSAAFKEKVKAAKAQAFNQQEALNKVMMSMAFNARHHSRDQEQQADAMAFELFVNTSFGLDQAKRMMQLFEHIDEPMRDAALQLESRFSCEAYPFQAAWLEQSDGSVWAEAKSIQMAADKPMADSLRTHPDWAARLAWLESMAKDHAPGKNAPTATTPAYDSIKYLSILESVDAWAQRDRYDKALYYALLYQNLYPHCEYLKALQALALNALYVHTREHRAAEILGQTTAYNSTHYNQFLDFLNNLRLKELLGLQSCSVEQLKQSNSEYGLFAAYQLAASKDDKVRMKAIQAEYLAKYPKGRFAASIPK